MNQLQLMKLCARDKWLAAMREEMDSMAKNYVWELVDLPPTRKSIGNKWVFKIKRKADGTIDRYKARLVAKGYPYKIRSQAPSSCFLLLGNEDPSGTKTSFFNKLFH